MEECLRRAGLVRCTSHRRTRHGHSTGWCWSLEGLARNSRSNWNMSNHVTSIHLQQKELALAMCCLSCDGNCGLSSKWNAELLEVTRNEMINGTWSIHNEQSHLCWVAQVGNFEVHYTPGHSAGHVFYMHRGLSAVFTGDRRDCHTLVLWFCSARGRGHEAIPPQKRRFKWGDFAKIGRFCFGCPLSPSRFLSFSAEFSSLSI